MKALASTNVAPLANGASAIDITPIGNDRFIVLAATAIDYVTWEARFENGVYECYWGNYFYPDKERGSIGALERAIEGYRLRIEEVGV